MRPGRLVILVTITIVVTISIMIVIIAPLPISFLLPLIQLSVVSILLTPDMSGRTIGGTPDLRRCSRCGTAYECDHRLAAYHGRDHASCACMASGASKAALNNSEFKKRMDFRISPPSGGLAKLAHSPKTPIV